MQQVLPRKDVVLLGIGHTNAHVLRMWRMKPIPDVRLTCISNFSIATYSGMLPGVLAGQYPTERMEIDLARLCAAAGARLIVAEVTGLDLESRELLFENRPPLRFDVLSIGIGSMPRFEGVEVRGDSVLQIKPMQTFLGRLEKKLLDWKKQQLPRPLRVCVVGGGAGGVEITFCLPRRVQAVLGETPLEVALVNAHSQLVPGMRDKTAATVRAVLEERGVKIHLGQPVIRVDAETVTLENGETIAADVVLWATSATALPLLRKLGLPVDKSGFLLTRPTLQTLADAPIFAVGDAGTIEASPTPKAGVYAVREGPILWENIHRVLEKKPPAGRWWCPSIATRENIHRVLEKKPLETYQPQKGFLKLLNTGDGKAILEYNWLTVHRRWCWKLKDYIDGKFMDKYQDYRPMDMQPTAPTGPAAQMRCAGCGGKIAGGVLSKVLSRLDIPASEHVLLGLDQPDDAAIVKFPDGHPIAVTVDFFAAPLDDPYLVGKMAALNSLSDVFAKGAQPVAALAMATLPVGVPRQQESMLFELLAGSLDEFRKVGATLVGGHTIEGPQLTIGFTILADQGDLPPHAKANLRTGDRLILTKPLGSGILLAAHMQAQCQARWLDALLPAMLWSNQPAANLARQFDIAAITDITGFGLAGHLLEMLHGADKSAELVLKDIPLFPGVEELVRDHRIESTLAPANRAAEDEITATSEQQKAVRYAALFDPQTCGGLLLGVPADQVEAVLAELAQQSNIPAAVIGEVVAAREGQARIRVV